MDNSRVVGPTGSAGVILCCEHLLSGSPSFLPGEERLQNQNSRMWFRIVVVAGASQSPFRFDVRDRGTIKMQESETHMTLMKESRRRPCQEYERPSDPLDSVILVGPLRLGRRTQFTQAGMRHSNGIDAQARADQAKSVFCLTTISGLIRTVQHDIQGSFVFHSSMRDSRVPSEQYKTMR